MSPNTQTVIIGYHWRHCCSSFQIMQFKIAQSGSRYYLTRVQPIQNNQLLEQLDIMHGRFRFGVFLHGLRKLPGNGRSRHTLGLKRLASTQLASQLGVMPLMLMSGTMNKFISPVINRRLNEHNEATLKVLRRMIYKLSAGWILVTAVSASLHQSLLLQSIK